MVSRAEAFLCQEKAVQLISCLANGESKLNEWGVRLASQAKALEPGSR